MTAIRPAAGQAWTLGRPSRCPRPFSTGQQHCSRQHVGRGRVQLALPAQVSAQASASAQPLPEPLHNIVLSFKQVPDAMARYKQLLHFAGRLAPLPAELRTREHKVQGCVSQVWVVPCLGADGRLSWRADSDSQLTKGLAALLVEGLSGLTPEQVAAMSPSFIQDLGFAEALTPSRNNGFLNMFKLMQRRALEYCLQRHGEDSNGASGRDEPIGGASGRDEPASPAAAHPTPAAPSGNGAVEQVPAPSSAPAEGAEPPFAQAVRTALQAELDPIRLSLTPAAMEKLQILVVSPRFAGLSTMKRQRLVHAALAKGLDGGAPAVSITALAPGEPGST